jgi:hypothetical protein
MLPRNAELWLPGLLASRRQQPREGLATACVDILFCIADHFEPARARAPLATQRARVATWTENLPRLAERFRDADGRPPQHTFFYPEEEYHPDHLDELARLCGAGLGEVEIHLHHDADTADGLRDKLERFKARLAGHGLLCRDRDDNRVKYAFIHGNWALDNSRRDRRMCGVNNELSILKETGCYADFTLPSAPSDTQTRTVNSIYHAADDPDRPKSHDRGIAVEVGRPPSGDLLLIQGPLGLDWRSRKWGLLPRLENGSLHAANPPTAERFQMWVDAAVGVLGRPEWVFIKVYTHGAVEENAAVLLGPAMERFHAEVGCRFNDGQRYRLHYVTAREMANLVRAAEAGEHGDPNQFRDYRLVRAT